MNICDSYCGIACINGSCPIVNAKLYPERCMDIITDCNDCIYYKGCDDCYFYNDKNICPLV